MDMYYVPYAKVTQMNENDIIVINSMMMTIKTNRMCARMEIDELSHVIDR